MEDVIKNKISVLDRFEAKENNEIDNFFKKWTSEVIQSNICRHIFLIIAFCRLFQITFAIAAIQPMYRHPMMMINQYLAFIYLIFYPGFLFSKKHSNKWFFAGLLFFICFEILLGTPRGRVL